MKIAYCLQHVLFEGPGVFRHALETRGYVVRNVIVPVEGLPADPGDFLLIMGGPMSVNDREPWIEAELQFVKTALARDIPVLGICFGAQLLAKSLGGSVVPGPKFELGMGSVSLTHMGKIDPILRVMPPDFFVFQWHGEGITLPHGSTHLVTSVDFPVQAFRMTDRTYGLLFHLELEEVGVELLCRECPQDVERGGMALEAIQAQSRPHLPRLHQLADRFMEHLVRA